MFKRLLLIAVIAAIVAGAGVVAFALIPTKTRQIAAPAELDDKLVEAGRYVAVVSDCTACHTAPDGQPFAGGAPIASPIGAIYPSNITPDRETGIGTVTLDGFDRLVRHGITRRGITLYPAMPYPSYAKLSDADVVALYAYFMKGVAPVHAKNRKPDIPWPLSMRWPLGAWRKLFAPSPSEGPFDAARYPDPVVARGAYLVQGPGHCGTCHTPRAITLQEKGLDERSSTFLSGGQVIDGWVAVNLRGDASGLAAMSADDIVAALRTGRSPGRAVIGQPMKDVVVHSTQDMTDGDLRAIAAYLKTLAPGPAGPVNYVADSRTADDLRAGKASGRGAELYLDNCAACHRSNGKGAGAVFPAMAGNPTVLAGDPNSLIRLILVGGAMPSTSTAPSNLGMPAFGWRLSDEEVAQLVTFIRQSWGNSAPATDTAAVTRVRGKIEESKAKAPGEKTPG